MSISLFVAAILVMLLPAERKIGWVAIFNSYSMFLNILKEI